jgi:16S rRNA (guanine527-N7)-methyltransferase
VEHKLELRKFIIASIQELGLVIEEIHADQFQRYLLHLVEWNKTINLTAIVDPNEIIIKHFVDSLTALVTTSFPKNSLVLDVGSGGGFPGIPLKIMRPDIRLVLVEPVQKKCSFLNSVIGLLKLQDASLFNGTIEQYARWPLRQTIDVVVIRALKYNKVQMHVPALLTSNGKIILYRTETLSKEEIGEDFHLLTERIFMLPQESGKRVVSVIERNT